MVSSRQRHEIKKLMRRVKDAKDENMSKQELEKRVTELYNYLEAEGIVNRDE